MRYFRHHRTVHTVNEEVGEQGRPGQVVAYCGYGTIDPEFITDLGPFSSCGVCAKNQKTVIEECGKGGCVLPVGHRPVRDVLPMPFQEHASSPWVRGAYLQALEKRSADADA